MPGLKSLVCLAFLGSIGVTLLIIGCALPGNWYPFFEIIFYFLTPIPTLLAHNRMRDHSGDMAVAPMDLAIFLTVGLVLSAFYLPIIMTRAPTAVISQMACYLTLSANVVVFTTILAGFMLYQDEESWWQI